MSVHEKVHAYLKERGLPPSEVAERAGIPPAVLRAMLLGKRAMHAEDMRALCYALGVLPETFIDTAGDMDGRSLQRQQ